MPNDYFAGMLSMSRAMGYWKREGSMANLPGRKGYALTTEALE